jgi:integrase
VAARPCRAGVLNAEPGGGRASAAAQWHRPDKLSGWPHAARAIGAEGLHLHDLRHTGNAFAAASGASLRDLMARMGHDSERAAIIYQRVARGADQAIAEAMDAHVEAQQVDGETGDDGASGVPVPAG